VPDNSRLATESIIEQFRWNAGAFHSLIEELERLLPEGQKKFLLQEMCTMGRDSARRYADLLSECVIIPLTDMLGGEK
jgi:hypothetical protein